MHLHGFELIKDETIAELQTRGRLYRHLRTGTPLLSLENSDENKVFGIVFRTPPHDSSGLPHIMEHAVLCGSRKYPSKEPFVELLKGSLQTFLNAFTMADTTVYPVASQNTRDFYNLVDVYLDAVLHPRITPEILQQEGWHYELEDPEQPLRYKGVVYNEMKGAYSSPDSLMYRYARTALLPDTLYGNEAGGDPRQIPELTYAQFKAYHETYYHPSNALIYFYGDDEPAERLRLVNSFLQEFEPMAVDAQMGLQPPFDAPRQTAYPFDASQNGEQSKSMVTVNWLLPEIADPAQLMLLAILSYSLVGTAASPLRKALIDSGLGEDVVGGGFSNRMRQATFSTGLRGIQPTAAAEVETLILQTLERLARDGCATETVEAAINTLEFNLRENNTGSYPRGLALLMRILSRWRYDHDLLTPLAFEAPLAATKAAVAAHPDLLQKLIRQHLLENNHRLRVELQPDPQLRRRMEDEEQARLAKVRSALDPDELQALIRSSRRLKELQEAPDDPAALAAIPMLTLADLPQENKQIPVERSQQQGSTLLYHDLFTNGIFYLDLGFNLHTLPQELLPLISLFSRSLLEIGTDTEDYVKLSQRIGRKTGGIWPTRFVSAVREQSVSAAWLFLRGKSTMAQAADLLAIVNDVLQTVRLDNQERFRQMVLEAKASKEASLIPSGHGVVNSRLRARFGEADWASEQMGGISNLSYLRRLAVEVENHWPAVLARLEQIRALLLNRNAMVANVTLDAANWSHFAPQLADFLAGLPAGPVELATWQPQPLPVHEGLTIPAQVNYVAKGANLYDCGYSYHGSMLAITNYLRTSWIWEQIRVRGGAYGGFCQFDRHSGVFSYFSYRDPNLLQTLDRYDETSRFLQESPISQEELVKSVIGAIGSLDDYQLPDAKGYTSLVRSLMGISDEERQRQRNELLATSVADFRRLGAVLEAANPRGNVVVMGSQEAIDQANSQRGNWLEVQQVL